METLAPSRPQTSLQRLIEHASSLYSQHPYRPRPWTHVAKHIWYTLYEQVPKFVPHHNGGVPHQNGADQYKALEAFLTEFLVKQGLQSEDAAHWLAGPTTWFAREKQLLDGHGTRNVSAYEAARQYLKPAFFDYQKWFIRTLSDTFRKQS